MGGEGKSAEVHSESKELLLEDYRYVSESFWKNEQGGETRVNLFVGFVTLVVGALMSLATSEKVALRTDTLRLIIVASLSALLVLGVITLLRMLIRNENTDRYKRGLDTVRQLFKDRFDDDRVLMQYYAVAGPEKKFKKEQTKKWWKEYGSEAKPRKFGGLAHTVAAINSVLCVGIIGAAVYPTPVQNATSMDHISVITAFILSLLLQLIYVAFRDIRSKKELLAGIHTHAGGVVYRTENGVAKYLLVRAKDKKDDKEKRDQKVEWVLPKGHIEQGEGHGEAACREVREEAGVIARIVELIDSVEFKVDGEDVRAKFYLMEWLFQVKPIEVRERKWSTFDGALDELRYEESRHLLREAEKKRERSRRRTIELEGSRRKRKLDR